LIIVEGNNVVLIRNGQRSEAEILPPMYHSLKAIAHIPFAVFLIFEQLGNEKLLTRDWPSCRTIEGSGVRSTENGLT